MHVFSGICGEFSENRRGCQIPLWWNCMWLVVSYPVQVLGTELWSSRRGASASNHWTIPPALYRKLISDGCVTPLLHVHCVQNLACEYSAWSPACLSDQRWFEDQTIRPKRLLTNQQLTVWQWMDRYMDKCVTVTMDTWKINGSVVGWSHGWMMSEWIRAWIHGWVSGWMHPCVWENGCIHECMGG